MLAAGATIISDGVFKVDGGAIFGRIPKMIWEDRVSTDRQEQGYDGAELPAAAVRRQEYPGGYRDWAQG